MYVFRSLFVLRDVLLRDSDTAYFGPAILQYSRGTVQEHSLFQQRCFLILSKGALFLSCLGPEGLFEEDANVGLVHVGASRALLILSLEAPRSSRRGFNLIRLILWHCLDCMSMEALEIMVKHANNCCFAGF